ncbi:MAG: hypothetical protein ACHQ17_11190, partial [Polyangia bacterium]
MKRLAILALLVVGGCANGPEAAIRDVRPTKLQLGEKVLVEANGELFQPGAPTTITFDRILDVNRR